MLFDGNCLSRSHPSRLLFDDYLPLSSFFIVFCQVRGTSQDASQRQPAPSQPFSLFLSEDMIFNESLDFFKRLLQLLSTPDLLETVFPVVVPPLKVCLLPLS